jgi:hypothetical protein
MSRAHCGHFESTTAACETAAALLLPEVFVCLFSQAKKEKHIVILHSSLA